MNPDAPDSPMAIMEQTLTSLLKEHSRAQAEALKQQQERQERSEKGSVTPWSGSRPSATWTRRVRAVASTSRTPSWSS